MKKTTSDRRKRWFFARSMARAYQDWLENRTRSGKKASKKAASRPLFAEALEPRVLFSATPAPVEEVSIEVDEAAIAHTSEELNSTVDRLEKFIFDENEDIDFTEADLERLAVEAAARWKETGLTEDQIAALEDISYVVTDLEGSELGAIEGNSIYLDYNAAGADWFVDETEWIDEEFVEIDGILRAESAEGVDGLAEEGIDMLSVIMHEQGHILGLLDEYELGLKTSVMYVDLDEGERRILDAGQAEGAEAGSLSAAHLARAADEAQELDTLASAAKEPSAEDGPVTVSEEQVDFDAELAQVSQESLEAIAEVAADRWRAAGLTAEQSAALDGLIYRSANLPGFVMGTFDGSIGVITIDNNASGVGWFVDTTPEDDVEFGSIVDPAAEGKVDLLTLLMHEQGHALGLFDGGEGLMAGAPELGARILPGSGEAVGAIAGSVSGIHYAAVTVDGFLDVVDGDTSSISNLMGSMGADGVISLREAIIASNNTAGADVINLSAGTYSLSINGTDDSSGDLDIRQDLDIIGAGAGSTIIDAGGSGGTLQDRVMEVHGSAVDLGITGVTIQGGYLDGTSHGAGIYINQSNVALDDVEITGNTVRTADLVNNDRHGGGFWNNNGTVTGTAVEIHNNLAEKAGAGRNSVGGGFWNSGGGDIILTDSSIHGNTAREGAGFHSTSVGSTVILNGVIIEDNIAVTTGGGFRNNFGSVVTIQNSAAQDSIIRGNESQTSNGAGFYNFGGTTNIIGTAGREIDVTENKVRVADRVGGGFQNTWEGTVNLSFVDIFDNEANEGGGFYQDSLGSSVIGDHVTIDSNVGRTRGGGFRNATIGATVSLTDSVISNNEATEEHGGGFYNNGTTTLTNTNVDSNFALDLSATNRRDAHGGGFYNGGGTVNLLSNTSGSSDVINNYTYGIGGGFWNNGGNLTAEGSTIDGNKVVMATTSTRSGGGFWSSGDSSNHLTDVIISHNETGKDTPLGTGGTRFRGVGGGFYNTDGSTVTIDGDSQIFGNQAEEGAGFFNSSSGSTVNITGTASNAIEIGTAAEGNTARVRGGGFRSAGNTNVNLEYVIIENNTAQTERGGGFYADGAQITGSNVTIKDNQTIGTSGSRQGAAGWISSTSVVDLADSLVTENRSSQNGGGFYVENGTLNLTGTTISENYSQNSGGGLMVTGSSVVTGVNSAIIDNIARDHGGGFYITDDSRATFTLTNVNGNLAGYESNGMTRRESGTAGIGGTATGADLRGGGFRALGRARVTLVNSTLNDNEAARYGGGFDAENEPLVTLLGTTVSGNVASNHGGGIRLASSAQLVATNSTISGNYTGFMRANSGDTITANYDGRVGGGLWSQSSGNRAIFNQVTMADNYSTAGGSGAGAGIHRSSGFIQAENSIFYGNIADAEQAVAGQDASDIRGAVTLVGANIIGVHSASGGSLSGDTNLRMAADPGLQALADNASPNTLPDGGTPQTHAITADSAAAGAAVNPTVAVDQLGNGRPGSGTSTSYTDFNSSGADLLTNPDVTIGVRTPTVAGTSLQFLTGGAGNGDSLLTLDVLPPGQVLPSYPMTFTVEYDFTKITGDHDPQFRLSDGVNTVVLSMADNDGGRLTLTGGSPSNLFVNGGPATGIPSKATMEFVLAATGTTVNGSIDAFSGSSTTGTALNPFGGLTLEIRTGDLGEDYQIDNLSISLPVGMTGQEDGADLGAYEVDAVVETLTLDEIIVPETVISGEVFDVEALATTTGGGSLTYAWTLADPAGTGASGDTGVGGTTSLTGTTPNTDPIQTVDLILTVTDTTTMQSVTETRQVRIVDPSALPATFTNSIVVDKLGDEVDGDITVGNVTLREAINAANASGAGTYGITFDAGITNGNNIETALTYRELNYDSQGTGGVEFTIGQILTGATSGTQATIIDIIGDNSTGDTTGRLVLDIVPATGTGNFVNNEAISDSNVGTALANGSLFQSYNTGYDYDITKTNGAVFILGNGTSNTIVDGNSVDRVFDIRPGANVFFKDLTITGGVTTQTDGNSEHGGGVKNEGGIGVFEGVDITGNTAAAGTNAGSGGGIFTTSSGTRVGLIYMIGGNVSNNNAESNGGGLYMAGSNAGESLLSLDGTTISGNVASAGGDSTLDDRRGGGFYVTDDGNKVIFNNVSVTGNRTDGDERSDGGGGAFTGSDHTIEITGGSFTGNRAGLTAERDSDGGGLWIAGSRSEITLDGVTIGGELAGGSGAAGIGSARGASGNYSSDDGGGFYMEGRYNTLNLVDTLIVGNESQDNGGGFFVANDTETVNITQTTADGSQIRNNFTATAHGGGFFNIGSLTVTGTSTDAIEINWNEARFTTNNGDIRGGGFYNSDTGVANLTDVHVDGNVANRHGGGFWNSGGGTVNIDSSDAGAFRSTVSGNSTLDTNDGDGGGFYNTSALSVVNLTDVVVDSNTTTDEGGAFYASSNFSVVNLLRTDLTNNESQDNGGGFYNASDLSKVDLREVLIDSNTSVTEHGGGFRNNGIVTGADVIISNNYTQGTANDNRVGGGIYNEGGEAIITLERVEISDNFAHGRGGGIYNNIGTINFTDFVIAGNVTDQASSESQGRGGGIWNSDRGSLNLADGTISNNRSFGHGAGINQQNTNSTMDLINVTISGNVAGWDADDGALGNFEAGRVGGGIWSQSETYNTLNHVTVTDNKSTSGTAGGGGVRFDSGGTTVTMTNSIVFGNTINAAGINNAGDIDNNIGTRWNLQGLNIVGSSSGTMANEGAGRITTDPNLGSLSDNGGFSQTHLPALGNSAAIDAAVGSTATADQRGVARTAGSEDLGAVEAPAALYVNDQWSALSTGDLVDGDLEFAGSQDAFIGTGAFATVADALAKYVGYAGNIIVNGGTYASVDLTGGGAVTLQLVQDLANSENDVVFQSITDPFDAGDTDTIVTRHHGTAEADLVLESGVFSGTITGSGNLVKQGTGNVLLSGASDYTGTTTVQGGGKLEVNGTVSTIAAITSTASLTILDGQFQVAGDAAVTVTNGVINGTGAGRLLVDDGTMTVGDGLDVDTLRVGYNGGTGSLTASGGTVLVGNGTEAFDIGRRDLGNGATLGTVDFSAASSVTINVASLRMGTDTGGSGSSQGDLTLSSAGANVITATTIGMGANVNGNNQSASTSSDLHLGGSTNVINVNTFTVGAAKSVGTVDIVSGGILTLRGAAGGTSRTADLRIGYNASGTGTTPAVSSVDLSGALTTDLLVGNLVIGRHVSGIGAGDGILTFDSGMIDANTVTLGLSTGTNPRNTSGTINQLGGAFTVNTGVIDGGGDSTLNIDNGTFNVSAGLDVDNLRVGYRAGTASLTVLDGVVRVGDGQATTAPADPGATFNIGRRDSGDGPTLGTVDFGAASSVTINVENLWMGTDTTGSGSSQGDLTLSQTGLNTVTATSILIGKNVALAAGGNTNLATSSDLHLGGGDNNFNVNTFTVGGDKSVGTVDIVAGGTLTLDGITGPGSETDLRIGYNNVSTSANPAQSEMDLSGGTFDATLDALEIGIHGAGGGSGRGILTYEAGTVTANSVTLAEPGAGTAANTTGAIDFDGDELDLQGGDVVAGSGVASFIYTDGRLKDVNNFGLDLIQQGGTLQIGADGAVDTMTVDGDYTSTTGATLEIDVNGTAGTADQLIVNDTVADSTVNLGGSTLSLNFLSAPSAMQTYTLVDNDESGDAVVGSFTNHPRQAANTDVSEVFEVNIGGTDHVFRINYAGGDGNDVVLESYGEAETSIENVGGILTITDINGGTSDDDITITDTGTHYVISDPNLALTTSIGTAERVDGNTIRVLKAGITGLLVDTKNDAGGGDEFTIGSAVTVAGDVTITSDTINLDASLTATGNDITFNGNVIQGAANVTLTGVNIDFNGNTTLDSNASANTFALNASGAATNNTGNLFNMNGGRFQLLVSTEFVNDGSFEVGANPAGSPIFSSNNPGNKITNNGTFTHNGSSLRLYVEITNTSTGTLVVDNPTGSSEIQFIAVGSNGPGGSIVNQNTMTVSEDTARFDGTGSITNANGGTIEFAAGSSSIISETVTLTNESGGILNVNDDLLIDGTAGTIANESGGTININLGVVTLSGSGSVTNESGGVVNLDSNLTINGSTASFTNALGGDVNLVGGPLSIFLNGTGAEFTNNGTVTWASGAGNQGSKTVTGAGIFVNGSTAVFDHNYAGADDNFVLNSSVTFQNDGIYNLNGNGDIDLESNAEFVNNGDLIKTAAGGDPSFVFTFGTTGGTFTQTASGTVESQAGQLRFATENASSDAAGTWTANGGDIEFAGEWTGTVTGTTSGSGDFLITYSGNPGVMSDFSAGTGGVTFDVSGNGLTWSQQTITTSAGNDVTNADTMIISGAGAKTLAGAGQLITANGATTTLTGDVLSTGGSSFLVEAGGVLNGTGSFAGAVAAEDESEVAPGLMSIDELGTGNLDLQSGSTYTVDLDGSATGTSDTIDVTGTVTLGAAGNRPTLDIVFAGALPTAGQSFTLINNDGGDAVDGIFDGYTEGSIISLSSGGTMVPTTLLRISYAGGDGNDVTLTASDERATTEVELVTNGTTGLIDLVINDIDDGVSATNNGNSDDAWTITVEGTEVVIRAEKPLGTLESFTQNDFDELRVDMSLFTGDVILNGLSGNDEFTIGDLGNSVLPGGIIVNGGDGLDVITYSGVGSVLAAGADASFTAEEIDFKLNSDLETTDGDITAIGTGGIGNLVGVQLRGSDLTAGGTGSVTLSGEGGDSGNNNYGVQFSNGSTVTTVDGAIDIDGAAGGDATSSSSRGVAISTGTVIRAGGSGDLTIDGSGGSGTRYNHGVAIISAELAAADGDIIVSGTGTGSLGGNGVDINGTDLTGNGNIEIIGTSDASGGSGNRGMELTGVTIDASGGSGSIELTGTGSADSKSDNQGILLSNVDIEGGTNGDIDITGTARSTDATGVNNTGVSLLGGSTVLADGSGNVTLTGTGGNAKSSNRGIHIIGSGSEISAVTGDVILTGTGGGSGGSNRGIELTSAKVTTGGNVTMVGSGSLNGGATKNTGIFLNRTIVEGLLLNLTGNGGAGSSYNYGMKVSGGSLRGSMTISGLANIGTSGIRNQGVSIANADLDGTTTITGVGGGGSGHNHGIYMNRIGLFGGGTPMGTAGGGSSSEATDGNFFANP